MFPCGIFIYVFLIFFSWLYIFVVQCILFNLNEGNYNCKMVYNGVKFCFSFLVLYCWLWIIGFILLQLGHILLSYDKYLSINQIFPAMVMLTNIFLQNQISQHLSSSNKDLTFEPISYSYDFVRQQQNYYYQFKILQDKAKMFTTHPKSSLIIV